jgi:UDP-glucose 4-epimerase
MVDIERAMDCIEYALNKTGYSIVPNLKSFKVKDLFEIYEEKFGLKWKKGAPRISEKYHEQMISPHESGRVSYDKEHDMYLIHYKDVDGSVTLPPEGLSSENCLLPKKELKELLEKYNYFKP